jgi:two-component system sensor histidine kinase KdpD
MLKPKLDWCDLSDIIRSTVQKHAGELSRHNMTVEVDSAAPLVKLDHDLMEQVLWNLLNNAALYTPAGTNITIAARVENDTATITVCDDGPGIPAEASEKIFQKFYRVAGSKSGGTGLGLSIAQGFVEAMGGKLTVVNRPAGGACFAITLQTTISTAKHVVA